VKRTSMQNSAVQNNCSTYLSSDVCIILFSDEMIFTMTALKDSQNDRLYAVPSTKKDVATKRRSVTDGISRQVAVTPV